MSDLIALLQLVWPIVAVIAVIALLASLIVYVPGDGLGVVERRFIGREMPEGRVIAANGEVGIQAKTLAPGIHFFIPFLFRTKKIPFMAIPDGQFGLVESIDGKPVPQGRIFAKVTEGHSLFQDGEAFLSAGGEKGPQVQLIPPGFYRINTFLFKVTLAQNVVIPPGKIGVVTAMDGQPLEAGRLLGKSVQGHSNFENGQVFLNEGGQRGPQIDILQPGTYRINTSLFKVEEREATVIPANMVGIVTALDGATLPEGEFMAKAVANHSDFQNASAFLAAGGQRGPQFEVLRPGTYYINPLMFRVETDQVTTVQRGEVAVLISNVGKKATREMVQAAEGELDEHYVVPAGYRGIQREVVGPGSYYFNRKATVAHMVQTTNITIDWDADEDTKFDPIVAISKDGFTIKVSVKVVVCVKPDMAPFMVAKIGSIENLISNVVHPLIDSSFRNQASSTSAMEFLQDRSNQQTKAENHTRSELNRYFVETVSVLICGIELPQDLMDTQTRKIIAEQQTAMYAAQQTAETARITMENKKAEANQQGKLVEAEMGVSIERKNKERRVIEAEASRDSATIEAEGKANATRTNGQAEADMIRTVGEAKASSYKSQVDALGSRSVAAIEMLTKVADGQIKITPDILVNGNNGERGSLLDVFFAQQLGQREKMAETKTEVTA